jgi:cephalosporin hydroxylase
MYVQWRISTVETSWADIATWNASDSIVKFQEQLLFVALDSNHARDAVIEERKLLIEWLNEVIL